MAIAINANKFKNFLTKMFMKKSIVIMSMVALLVFAGCANTTTENSGDNDKISVVTTLFPMYDFAKIIGGDKVEVSLLLPPGVEPHSFEPTPSDVVKINGSDLFVYTGEFMEPWAHDIIDSADKKVIVFDSSVGIEMMKEEAEHEHHEDEHHEDEHHEDEHHEDEHHEDEHHEDEHHEDEHHEDEHHEDEHHEDEHHHDHGGVDPHIWLAFDNAEIMVSNIEKALIAIDPDNATYYEENATKYIKELNDLDKLYGDTLKTCESKSIVYGGHYAFGYLSKEYGLTYVAAQGFSPDSEPSAQDLATMVEQIKNDNIDYIFYEELTSPKIAETLANETKAKMLLLNGAHNIAKDDYKNGTTYLSIMKSNLENLKTGLHCK